MIRSIIVELVVLKTVRNILKVDIAFTVILITGFQRITNKKIVINMGTFIFRLCIDNTLCLVTAFDKIEAEHMLEKNKGIISKAEYYFVGVTSGVITISKDGNLTY